MKKHSKMKKSNPNQKTLFQSWGKKSQPSTSSSTTTRLQQPKQNAGFDPLEIIDLGDDDEDDGLLAAAMEMESMEQNTLARPSTSNVTDTVEVNHASESQEVEHLPGFDVETGNVWIYPTNYPVRNYQYQIVENALYKNTLVTLPTGLGKTFIAAVLMYNYYRWYPQGKVIFMAPTKPLVAQQIEACYNIMGIPESDTSEMTGNMAPVKRESMWKTKRVFFLTPQVLQNDLARGSCDPDNVVLLVFDEAHKALGNHAYCQVVKEIYNYTRQFRVLALSATPGDDIKAVQQVMSNLLISHMELRSEDSPDIQAYTHNRTVDKIVVPLGEDIIRIKTQYLKVLEGIVARLFCNRVLWQKDPQHVTKFMLLSGRNKFREREAEGYVNGQKGMIEGDFAMAISLYHAYELLHQHGILSFYNFIKAIMDGSKGMARAKTEMRRHPDFMQVMEELQQTIERPPDEVSGETSALFSQFTSPRRRAMMREAFDPSFQSHPKLLKLEEVIVDHFRNFFAENDDGGNGVAGNGAANGVAGNGCAQEVNTRVMIFSQYRDSVGEITAILNKHKPLVRVMSFIGQASTGKSSRGLSQKEQLEVVQRFRKGGYNTLVATCVGEEGLDIGDVDLIVCFDAHASPIRLVQRMGRTGRKRNGRIVVLVTEGKEEQVYKRSLSSKKSIHKAIVHGSKSFELYDDNPRMIPKHLTPRVHKMAMTVGKYVGNAKKSRKSEANNSKGNISNYLSKSTSKTATVSRKDDGLLTYEELTYWQENFKLPNCEAGTTPSRRRRSHDSLSDQSVKKLSLNEWMPWQNVPQSVYKIEHSRRTEHMIEILEFMELHGEEDDSYDVEMMSFLNEEDLPGVNDVLGDDDDDAPVIILDDGDEVRLGSSPGNKKSSKTKRKSKDDSTAENKKKKRTSADGDKGKTKKSKDKTRKSKEGKETSPRQKWKEYLKAIENEDNDFETVEAVCTTNDPSEDGSTKTPESAKRPNDSSKRTSNQITDGDDRFMQVEQHESAGQIQKMEDNEKVESTPETLPVEEDSEDEAFLSSQQVSQLLPSVTPNAFHGKILNAQNCVKDVPTPPSLDSLNTISPFATNSTNDAEKLLAKRNKIEACRRKIQKNTEEDTIEKCFSERANDNSREVRTQNMIEDNMAKTSSIIEEPPDCFELDEIENIEEDPVFHEKLFKTENHFGNDESGKRDPGDLSTDETESLFKVDLFDDILGENGNEKFGSDLMKNDFEDRCKSLKSTDIESVPDLAQLGDLEDNNTKSESKAIDSNATFGVGIVCPSSSKSFNEDLDFEFGNESLNDGLLAQCLSDTSKIANPNGAVKDGVKIKSRKNKEDHLALSKNYDIIESVKSSSEANRESKLSIKDSKLLRPSLKSSIAKLSAFERNERTLDCQSDTNIENDNNTEVACKTVAESSEMISTNQNRRQDDFEFKKPSISMVNRYPKSPNCNGLNHSSREPLRSKVALSKTNSASSKLSLKKNVDNDEGMRSPTTGKGKAYDLSYENVIQSYNEFPSDNVLDVTNSQVNTSPISKSQLIRPLRERIGFAGTQKQVTSPRTVSYSSDENSPVVRKRKSKAVPNMSMSDCQPSDEDSPIVRKYFKSKTIPEATTSNLQNMNKDSFIRKHTIPKPPPTNEVNSTIVDSPIIRKRLKSNANISTSLRPSSTVSEDEDSPIVKRRSKPKPLLTISSPTSPQSAFTMLKDVHDDDKEPPPIRRRSKIKKQNGDVVAIAESDDEDVSVSMSKTSVVKMDKALDKKNKTGIVESDSEDEFMEGNRKQDKDGIKMRKSKKGKDNIQVQTSLKRKRQPSHLPSKKQRMHHLDNYIDDEAELSGSDIEEFSDEEEDYNGEFDSFIDDSSQRTQQTPTQTMTKSKKRKKKSSPAMMAVYRQSLFSPMARDLNFKTPTMHRSKNKYKMKFKVGLSDGSASEAEETYERESDLENELGDDSVEDDDIEGETLLLDDDDELYDDYNDDESDDEIDDDEKGDGSHRASVVEDATPEASQVSRPLKRIKRKRILNESTEDDDSDTNTSTKIQSPLVAPLKDRISRSNSACSNQQSSFVKSSTLYVNNNVKQPPTCKINQQRTSLSNDLRSMNNTNSGSDDNEVMPSNTTFEIDWGLDFSDADLLDAMDDDAHINNVDDGSKEQFDKNVNTKESDVCDTEMAEIAFAMAATDDDVNMEMTEMPTFSLGLDLFGDMDESIDQPVDTSTTAPNQKSNSSTSSKARQPQNVENKFTKISPRNSSKGNTNSINFSTNISSTFSKNGDFSTSTETVNSNNSSRTNSTNLTKSNESMRNNNSPRTNFNSSSFTKNSNVSTTKDVTSNRVLGSRNAPSENKAVPYSTSSNIPDYALWKNAQNNGTTISGKSKSVSVVRPISTQSLHTAQSDDFWSSSTSSIARSKSVSEIRPTEAKGVSNLGVKPGPSSSTSFVSPSQKDKGKLVMLVDTKEISISQVSSFLRRHHNIKVEVCQLQHCDYVVSNRMGVIRKLASAVSNGANSTKILEKMRVLCDLYDRPCFIIEKDRVKTGETERDFSKSNSYIHTLACMAQTHIKVLFSQSSEETASLLTDLATLEARKNTHIVAPLTMNKETQQVFKFLLTIPRVSYVTALNMCSSMRTLRDLLSCSAEDLQKTTRQLTPSRAAEIHSFLRHGFDKTTASKNIKINI